MGKIYLLSMQPMHTASPTFTDAVFGGQNQDPNRDHTFDIQVKEVGEDVSLGRLSQYWLCQPWACSIYLVSTVDYFLSAVNIDTVSLGSSGYGYNWNTSANGNDNHHLLPPSQFHTWGQTLELDDISIGVLDQAATNLVFLRTQNGTEHTKLQEYHSKKVDYEVAKVAIGVGTPFSFSKEIMHTPQVEVDRANLLMAVQTINRTILLPSRTSSMRQPGKSLSLFTQRRVT